jgi:hypothetical protein
VFIGAGGGGRFVTNAQMSEFDTGIHIQGGGPNLHKCFFSNVHCESAVHAVYIFPETSTGTIYQVFFDNCLFFQTHESTSATAGVYIDTNGGPSTNVSDIFFSNCMCHDWAGPGIQINSGQDIVVTGGRYGSNARISSMGTSGGIAVTGPAVRVSITGADCSGLIPPYNSQPPGPNLQAYGISVTGGGLNVLDMQVTACNLQNNKNGPLYVPPGSSTLDLRVFNCSGYNDQASPVTTTAPISNTPFSGKTHNYFGPVVFYVTGTSVSQITIYAVVTGLTSGSFTLTPLTLPGSTQASITYGGVPPRFLMIGI